MNTHVVMDGPRSGSVTLKNFFHEVAPSTSAASSTSVGTA